MTTCAYGITTVPQRLAELRQMRRSRMANGSHDGERF